MGRRQASLGTPVPRTPIEGLEFHHVARENNQAADILACIGAKRDPVPPNIFLEKLFKASVVWQGESGDASLDPNTIPDPEHTDIVGGSPTEITPSTHLIMAVIAPWAEPFLSYLNRKEVPEDQNEAHRIVRRSKAYKVHDGELYKKSATEVLQRCISEEEGRNLLAEIHAGLGGHHRGPGPCKQGLPYRILLADGPGRRSGLSPTLCWLPAFCKPKPYAPTTLQTIPITWPFAV